MRVSLCSGRVTNTFSGLVSMWTRPNEWMYCKPLEQRKEGEGGGGEGEGEEGGGEQGGE